MNHISEVGSWGLTESPPEGWGRGKNIKGAVAQKETREVTVRAVGSLSHHHSKFEPSGSRCGTTGKGIWLKSHWQNPGGPKFTLRYRHVPCLSPCYSKQRPENRLVQARSLTQVAQMSPHPSSQHQLGSGCTSAIEHQEAQERHGCCKRLSRGRSAEKCAPSSGVPPRNCGLRGPGACTIFSLLERRCRPTW